MSPEKWESKKSKLSVSIGLSTDGFVKVRIDLELWHKTNDDAESSEDLLASISAYQQS